jgi:hypothetical protein
VSRYLSKAQVTADFKLNYLPKLEGHTQDTIILVWGRFLDSLKDDKKITQNQRNIWTFPKELLT